MTGTLGGLVFAMGMFVLSHVVLSLRPVRQALVGKVGEVAFLIGYSVIALALFYWIIAAYNAAPVISVWYPPTGMRHLSLTIMPFAFIFLVAGYSTPNPTALALDPTARLAKPPTGIQAITRHPVMWAVALWGISHLLANGTIADIILFGGITVLALVGALHIDSKRRQRLGEAWAPYAAATSYFPFVAIASGRNRFSLGAIGWWRIGLGLALYVFFLSFHRLIFGVSPLPV